MKITDVPYCVTDWSTIPATQHDGETGIAYWHTVETGNLRVRFVTYSPGYKADHWCSRGHVVLVLEGELVNERKDGSKSVLTAGMSYQVADDEANPHRSVTETGATLFIVD